MNDFLPGQQWSKDRPQLIYRALRPLRQRAAADSREIRQRARRLEGTTPFQAGWFNYFRQKVDEGLQQLDANEGVPHDEATKRLKKWLA